MWLVWEQTDYKKLSSGGGHVAQLVKCLPHMYEVLGSIPSTIKRDQYQLRTPKPRCGTKKIDLPQGDKGQGVGDGRDRR